MKPNPWLIPRLNVEFGIDDLQGALNSVAMGPELEQSVSSRWPGYRPLFVDSGRAALYLALKASGFRAGAKIGVPLYTCEAVFGAIVRAECTPVFLDIDPRTYTIDPHAVRHKASDLEAVVPVHVFGQPVEMDGFSAGSGALHVIEDCAHGLGTSYRGSTAGSLGDASFFSFRLGKPVSAGNVGMALFRDGSTFERARELWAALPERSPTDVGLEAIGAFVRAALYRRPWFGLVVLPAGNAVDAKLDLMQKQGVSLRRAAPGALRVLSERLVGVDKRVEAARRNARAFAEAVEAAGLEPPYEAPWGGHSYYQFAIRFRSAGSRERGLRHLASLGVDAIRFYDDSPALAASRYGYHLGECLEAEAVAATVLTVPCHSRLKHSEVDRICRALRTLAEVV